MAHQLIVQAAVESMDDFDSIVELEDRLIKAVGTSANVDGHDFGSGEANIFIITPDALATFEIIRPTVESREMLSECVVAYRDINRDAYTVLWLEGFAGAFAIK